MSWGCFLKIWLSGVLSMNLLWIQATSTHQLDQNHSALDFGAASTSFLPLNLYHNRDTQSASLTYLCCSHQLCVSVIDRWTLWRSVSKCHCIMNGALITFSLLLVAFMNSIKLLLCLPPVCLSVCRISSWASMFSVIPTICFGFQVSATLWNGFIRETFRDLVNMCLKHHDVVWLEASWVCSCVWEGLCMYVCMRKEGKYV